MRTSHIKPSDIAAFGVSLIFLAAVIAADIIFK
jgi:hypothetical protein